MKLHSWVFALAGLVGGLFAGSAALAQGDRATAAVGSDAPGKNASLDGFVYIAPGTFMMGSPTNEPWRFANETQHQVTLTHGIYVQSTEVTNQQYMELAQWAYDRGYVTVTSASLFDNLDGSTQPLRLYTGGGSEISFSAGVFSCTNPDHPVKWVTWYGSVAYCDWLSLQQGLPRAYDHSTWQCNGGNPYTSAGYRLPTEAEWEYACRAGSTTAFANGPITQIECSPIDPNLTLMGWYCGNAGDWTHPVAQKLPNAWGLYDMHGNLREWCNDRWNGSGYGGTVLDPVGPGVGDDRVVRGGEWFCVAQSCRSACRNFFSPIYSSISFGFRAAKSSSEAETGIVGWGRNEYGQCNVPAPNADFAAVAGGRYLSLGLKIDGSVIGWGWNDYGQLDIPTPNEGYIAVSAGRFHCLGLKSDGSIVAWGSNTLGQCEVPAPNTDFVAVAAGEAHSLGLKRDGSIVAWGLNDEGQCNVPAPNTGFAAVAAAVHSLGLKSDGSIVAWGWNLYGQCTVPVPNAGFVSLAAGFCHSLGLKADGAVVAWGRNDDGQCDVPSPNSGFSAVAAGFAHSLGLRTDGSVVAWGENGAGQCLVPSPNADFTVVAAGWDHSLAIRGASPVPVYLALFAAERCLSNGKAIVRWAFSSPDIRAVLHLWRQEPGRERICLSQALLGGQIAYDFTDPTPPTGSADYWLQGMETNGSANWYGPAHLAAAAVPSAMRLYSAAPNPFNPRTTIRFDLPAAGQAQLSIYDLAGRLVRVLVEGERGAGGYEAVWDGRDASGRAVPSGTYLARLVAGGKVEGVRLSLVR